MKKNSRKEEHKEKKGPKASFSVFALNLFFPLRETQTKTHVPETAVEILLAYPDPAHHILYVYTRAETGQISLVDMTGRTAYETFPKKIRKNR